MKVTKSSGNTAQAIQFIIKGFEILWANPTGRTILFVLYSVSLPILTLAFSAIGFQLRMADELIAVRAENEQQNIEIVNHKTSLEELTDLVENVEFKIDFLYRVSGGKDN